MPDIKGELDKNTGVENPGNERLKNLNLKIYSLAHLNIHEFKPDNTRYRHFRLNKTLYSRQSQQKCVRSRHPRDPDDPWHCGDGDGGVPSSAGNAANAPTPFYADDDGTRTSARRTPPGPQPFFGNLRDQSL